ncbi:ATP-dependent Clp protease proteolytic subunit [Desulfobacter postgatei]|jgi:ATP-dependent Clp protease protease subunit|uniref:ATP-dependent Clp protease proteolytic subunit n=1 Tax=Desulfobacter postgatei TaxID=2293 RepID=UPI002A36619B|nr:ATP-dependent Clp protease proteolytic subunit [Desulfobacter postgatei]MDX9963523.1 ATP-dependent Clp protease proteolytic subunit [Desulfobacter postgatei]
MEEYYLRVMTAIVPESVDAILKIVDENLFRGCKRIHLMLSTPGGSVAQGISLTNYLIGVPIELYTYNFGAIDSIGVSVYCAGIRRFCSPQSRFLIHRISLALIENQSIDEEFIFRKLREIEVDTNNVAAIISRASGMNMEKVVSAMKRQTILDAQGAIDCGIAHQMQSFLMPAGVPFSTISPNFSINNYSQNDSMILQTPS